MHFTDENTVRLEWKEQWSEFSAAELKLTHPTRAGAYGSTLTPKLGRKTFKLASPEIKEPGSGLEARGAPSETKVSRPFPGTQGRTAPKLAQAQSPWNPCFPSSHRQCVLIPLPWRQEILLYLTKTSGPGDALKITW